MDWFSIVKARRATAYHRTALHGTAKPQKNMSGLRRGIVELNTLTGMIVESAVEVQRVLRGPGLLESVYEEALALELELRGCHVARQVQVPVWYKGHQLMSSLRLDLLINDVVVVECKAVGKFNPLFISQAVTYLRLSNRAVALVIDFGQRPLRPGIRRIWNDVA